MDGGGEVPLLLGEIGQISLFLPEGRFSWRAERFGNLSMGIESAPHTSGFFKLLTDQRVRIRLFKQLLGMFDFVS